MGRADVGRSDGATLKYDYTSAGLNKKGRVEQPRIENDGNWRTLTADARMQNQNRIRPRSYRQSPTTTEKVLAVRIQQKNDERRTIFDRLSLTVLAP